MSYEIFLQLLSNFPSLEQVFVFHSKRNLSQEIELSPKLNPSLSLEPMVCPNYLLMKLYFSKLYY